MEHQIWIVFAILISGLVLFVWQRIRYDIVAALMLLAIGLTGIISVEEMFSGFASPAVITVGSALVVAKGLENSGILTKAERYLLRFENKPAIPFILLLVMVCIVSGFMNDIAALAITLPIALSLSRSLKLEPSKILIPLAYASIIGGSLTLIGTASNIVMGAVAERELGRPLGIFEFFPVGMVLVVAFVTIFLFIGKRVLPARASPYATEKFELPKYIAEVQLTPKSQFIDKTIGELEKAFDSEIDVLRVIREHHERDMPNSYTRIGLGDALVIKADASSLKKLEGTGLELLRSSDSKIKDLLVTEAVVLPNSPLVDKTAKQVYLRDRFNVTLLGISRHGSTLTKRIDEMNMRIGDVLLLEAAKTDIQSTLVELQCAPLRGSGISLHARSPPIMTLVIAAASITLSALGILPIEIALAAGAIAMLLGRSISLREAYGAVQWPILVLIGCIIPFGMAMANTGADEFIAQLILQTGIIREPIFALMIVFAATTLLSNVINNTAAAVFMAPVALQLGEMLDISGLPMLMGVIFGAAVPYLTPISHHSNLLVMEAGGYKFADYLRLGIPMTVATAVIVMILVPILWPF